MIKVVYFDEASALDILDQQHKGRMAEITKEMAETASQLSAEGEMGVKGKLNLFAFLNMHTGVQGKSGISKKGNNILTTTLTNTIFTSYKDIMNSEYIKSNRNFIELKKCELRIHPNSLTFIKSLAPFVKAYTNSADVLIQMDASKATEPTYDISLLDEILENAKGYYEFIANTDSGKKIVRFNLEGLRNNYRLSDLQKMDLTIQGVKVGMSNEADLDYLKEFENNSLDEFNLGVHLDEDRKHSEKLEVIDVILAGVE